MGSTNERDEREGKVGGRTMKEMIQEARWKKSCLAIRLEMFDPGSKSLDEMYELVDDIKANLDKLRGLCLWEKKYDDSESDSGNSTVPE